MTGATRAPDPLAVGIVGAGPRGLSVLERLCANERAARSGRPITVHLIDPSPPGAGGVWRPGQSRVLLMNTVASQITVYTDDSADIGGPVEPGPTLYEWARDLALFGGEEADGATLREARALGPDAYPTRAFYGRYLQACFARIAGQAPPGVRIRVHRSRAVAMADVHGVPGGPQGLRLEDGTRLNDLDAVVLAQGHLASRLTARQERTASLARIHRLTYLTPANPADVDLEGIAPGAPVLVRGLGLTFFDYMALLTEGRGGRFEERDGRLVYRPSGREPVIHAFSRRGVPYHSRGRNEKGAHGRHHARLLTPDTVARLRRARPEGLRFSTDLWPLIAREVECVYYEALLAAGGRAADRAAFADRYLHAGAGEADGVLDAFAVPPGLRWSWERIARPCAGRRFADRADFRSWLLDHLREDVREAELGNVTGPLKAALDVLRDLRNEIRLAVDHGGLAGSSYRDELEGWYTPLNAYLSIGPPPSRIRELIALIEAGVAEVAGPGTQVRFDTVRPGFTASSPEVPGEPVRSRVLIEARLPEPDIRRTRDPLLCHLLDTDQAAPYVIRGGPGAPYEAGGLTVTERPYRLVDGQGRTHPRRFAYGVPTESVHWVTAAGTRPGVDSVTLGDSDAIARAVLALEPVAHVPFGLRPAGAGVDAGADAGAAGVVV
ncbi:FAD/NAD(P)-binding protein [Nocardiopsis sp. RSe5-2]|uniref:FAD/NAD(P)-binding protein n=1 Tax=Nocardiopsis endophytica TaxID=3018445 RepID=A0ABT4UA89_9ACTN|nr:FAD/NAD(P)-binding protein [Nocardiopsis endophytica]MDA2813252.1 FAD/NAD(P)-binding protein [Nocardiopsis endophytica]